MTPQGRGNFIWFSICLLPCWDPLSASVHGRSCIALFRKIDQATFLDHTFQGKGPEMSNLTAFLWVLQICVVVCAAFTGGFGFPYLNRLNESSDGTIVGLEAETFWLCTANISVSAPSDPVFGLVTVPCINLEQGVGRSLTVCYNHKNPSVLGLVLPSFWQAGNYRGSSVKGGRYTRDCSAVSLYQARQNIRAFYGLLATIGVLCLVLCVQWLIDLRTRRRVFDSAGVQLSQQNVGV